MSRKKEMATVLSQEMLAEGIFSLWLETSAAAEAKPGQFLSIYTNDGTKLLPRPISICEIDKENGALRMVYRVTGEKTGTKQFSELKAGDQIPVIGPVILVVGMISFAYSTVLGWSYYGERCVEYFIGKKGLIPYRVLYVAVAVLAPVVALDLVWTVADTLNALMAIPNLVAILLLSGVIVKETDKYINDLDKKCEDTIPVVDK